MRRKSLRLETTGYYNSDGEANISYKETMYRIFKRRGTHSGASIRGSTSNRNNNSNSNDNGNRNDNSNNNGNRNSNSRSSTMSSLKTFCFLFFLLPLCFGFAYLSLSSNVLDSGPAESPVSPVIPSMDSNAASEDMEKTLRRLQDELLSLKKMINQLLPAADTLPNFALGSQGANVLVHLSSKTYCTPEAELTFFGIPIWKPPVSPRIVIQGQSRLTLGCCWAFEGGRGHLFISLSHPITISHVTLGHISKNVSPTGSISSAPKEFSVYGMETLDDEGSRLGTFLYDQDGDSVQTFKLPDHIKGVFKYVRLQVESNWGNPDYSCLYSFRVHGKLAD